MRLLNPHETAKMLGVEYATLAVWRHHKRYDLKYVKVGHRVMYKEEDVLDFIENHTVGGENEAYV